MNQLKWKLLVICLLALAAGFVVPFLAHITSFNSAVLFDPYNQFSSTLLRTIGYALVSGTVLIAFGFGGALLLTQVSFFSQLGKNLGILILPITLGNVSIAFICKLLIGDSAFFSSVVAESVYYKLAFLIALQLWQFGLLFIYLFWLNFQGISEVRHQYAIATKFSLYQKLKDIFLPHSINIAILLGTLGFVFSVFEESKIQYLFKASRGTDSELITNWLARNYHSALLVNPDQAREVAFNSGYIIAAFSLLSLIALYLVIYFFTRITTRSKVYFSISRHLTIPSGIKKLLSRGWAILLILFVIVPVVFCLGYIKFDLGKSILAMGFPLMMVFLATLVATGTAILFGIAARLGWERLLSAFTNRSLLFLMALFLLLIIPPLVILISGFNWMGLIGYNSEWLIYAIWIAGHTILSLPVLGSFVLFNHFRVSTRELNYLQVYRLNTPELLKLSFFSRFKAEYLLLFIIAFSFIWNEAILNNLFSDYIPSFVSGLKMLITGRGADYSQAFGYLLVSMLLAFLSVAVWRFITEKAAKLQPAS